jgi:hypothetical protein
MVMHQLGERAIYLVQVAKVSATKAGTDGVEGAGQVCVIAE